MAQVEQALADQKATLEKLGREKAQIEKVLTAAMADHKAALKKAEREKAQM